MFRILMRTAIYVVTFVLIAGSVGAVGFRNSQIDFYQSFREQPVPFLQGEMIPQHDPAKPTVAVVLGDTITEDFDFLMPYNLFSRTGAYNVYAVAPDRQVKSLTGGLDVVPHVTFQELDGLLGKSPDILVVPNMLTFGSQYQSVLTWIKKHADTTLLSICAGSAQLADAGLLKGKSAATHWQIMPDMKRFFPDTTWTVSKRYVVEGNIITSAGQTAGIDAVLYVVSKELGEPVANQIAKEVHYPSYPFLHQPNVDPYSIDLKFMTYLLNNAYQWHKQKTGVLLYNGIEELALSSIFDSYSDTGTTNVLTISQSERPVVTAHNLTLLARYQTANAPKLDKMIIPGVDAKTIAAKDIQQWREAGRSENALLIHANSPDRFVFEAPIEDLSKQEDILSAEHAVKRLEYRANQIMLEGKPFALETYGNLILLTIISLLVARFIDKRFMTKKIKHLPYRW
ncbi:DJ-1/PfpI family protein [Brevibacillus nitrificans]|uniref:DJ-1/PfpI family protein n=1 Tax=Brevibacillus nitrificans TaxID=651560 RepID=UPI00262D37B4|nr:DJ-1/PfpI family protein [Brevibacillus nitrificans]